MDKKLKRSIERLTEMDTYSNRVVRDTYINNIVKNLRRGKYPKGSLERIRKLISKHNMIKEAKQKLKN